MKTIVDRINQFVCRINFRCFDFFLICVMLPHLLRAFPLLISRLSLKYCRLATLMALFVSYLFLSLSGVTLSDILYLKHPRDKETTLSVILHFSTGSICYQNPNNDSSVPIKINCSFPENLCFKFDKKTEDNDKSPFKDVYPLINADSLMTNICNVVREIFAIIVSVMVIQTQKFINLRVL